MGTSNQQVSNKKITKKYYFSVEGETEQWYLEWLEKCINTSNQATYKVSFQIKIQKNPLKYAKFLAITSPTEIWHLADYESSEDIHVRQFTEIMDNMKEATRIGKDITYRFGYSNFTFDLWIILHKTTCNGTYAHRDHYLAPLNSAYGEHFQNMDEYKHEDNFKRCLKQLELSNVIDAVNRAEKIMQENLKRGYTLYQYKGYQYYKENPSLNVWQIVKKILVECGLK